MSNLSDVSQEAFDAAETTVISMLRDEYPDLDLRRGTVLRELLVRPVSAFYALESDRIEELTAESSLKLMSENSDVDEDSVNNILSNFATELKTDLLAEGIAAVYVESPTTYVLPSGFTLTYGDDYDYATDRDYSVSPSESTVENSIVLQGPDVDGLYYFLIPVAAVNNGVQYELKEGSALTPDTTLIGFVRAEAYTDIQGARDKETVEEAIDRLPQAIAHRGLESKIAIESTLKDPDQGGFGDSLRALSIQGFGDTFQLRDKYNPVGVATGGKVDLFVRTFDAPVTVSLEKTGVLQEDGTYKIDISAEEAPGYYAVRIVTDASDSINPVLSFDDLPAIGSYPLTETRGVDPAGYATHHLLPSVVSNLQVCTAFQTGTIYVHSVPPSGATKQFRVVLYIAPRLEEVLSRYLGILLT
jgi:hypothetical protein